MSSSGKYIVRDYNDLGRIYVHPDGNDTRMGTFHAPVKTITRGLALVTSSRLIVNVAPGSYSEPAVLSWPNQIGVNLVGSGCSVTSVSIAGYAASVIDVIPLVQTKTFTGLISGIEIDHSGETADGVYGQIGVQFSDAGGVNRKIQFNIKNCGWSWEEDTDLSIKVVHGSTSNGIRIYVSGDGSQQEVGAIYFAVANNADRLHLENLWLYNSVTLVGADQIRVRALRCIIPEHSVKVAFIGNSGLQTVTMAQCLQWTDYDDTVAEIFEKAESANVTGSTAVVPTS